MKNEWPCIRCFTENACFPAENEHFLKTQGSRGEKQNMKKTWNKHEQNMKKHEQNKKTNMRKMKKTCVPNFR